MLLWVATVATLGLALLGMGTMIYALIWGNSADGLSGLGLFAIGAVTFAITAGVVAFLHSGDSAYDAARNELDAAEAAHERAIEVLLKQHRPNE
jgi:hypothetical protein